MFDANTEFAAGTFQFYFVGNEVPDTVNIGMNFYFDHDFTATSNRISATARLDGAPISESSYFSTIDGSSYTYGQNNAFVFGANTLSYTSGGYEVTLTDSRVLEGVYDLVGATDTSPDGMNDVVGTITFTVTAVPEPSAVALGFGAAALAFASWRRKRETKTISPA